MGHRTTQRILDCAICGRTPDDGEYLWEMCGEYWCADCVDKGHDEPQDIPGCEGTNEALLDLHI